MPEMHVYIVALWLSLGKLPKNEKQEISKGDLTKHRHSFQSGNSDNQL